MFSGQDDCQACVDARAALDLEIAAKKAQAQKNGAKTRADRKRKVSGAHARRKSVGGVRSAVSESPAKRATQKSGSRSARKEGKKSPPEGAVIKRTRGVGVRTSDREATILSRRAKNAVLKGKLGRHPAAGVGNAGVAKRAPPAVAQTLKVVRESSKHHLGASLPWLWCFVSETVLSHKCAVKCLSRSLCRLLSFSHVI